MVRRSARTIGGGKGKALRREKSMAEPLLTPLEIASSPDTTALADKLNERIEEYLHVAIMTWLPVAFSTGSREPAGDYGTALVVLSGILLERHDDAWLRDVLDGPKGPSFSRGIQDLSAAVTANDRGDYLAGRDFAHSATRLLQEAANPAAELRASGEEVYSDHLLWEGQTCISLLNSFSEDLFRSRYSWLRAQMSLEKSICANQLDDQGTYQSAILDGLQEAESHHYEALFIRGLGFESLSEASLGSIPKSLSLAVHGLVLFWNGHSDLTKGYNLYTDLDQAADALRQPHLQLAVWSEATALLDQDSDLVKRAMAHSWYGKAAYWASLPILADSEFAKADALFAQAPQTSATARDRIDAEVWRAKAELLGGDLDRADSRLREIEPDLYKAPSFDPEIGYFTTAAEIAMGRNDASATDSALRSALFLSERALNSFPDEDGRRHWASQTRDVYRSTTEWMLRRGDATSALRFGNGTSEPASQREQTRNRPEVVGKGFTS